MPKAEAKAVTAMEATQYTGAFYDSLIRSNEKIKESRAKEIYEDAELTFRRYVEDLRAHLIKTTRARRAMLDLSPDSSISLTLAKNFNANNFVETDLRLGEEIKEISERLELAEERYEEMFGRKA